MKAALQRREVGVGVLWVLLVFAVGIWNPRFLSLDNFASILVYAAPTAIVACGVMLVVVTGEIDISVGSLMGLSAAVLGFLASPAHYGLPVWMAITGTLALGAIVGLANGLLVSKLRVPSIIVTLGMLTILKGVTELLMGGRWITQLPPGLREWGTGSWLGLSWSVWVAALVVAATAGLIHWTALGRRVFAVGSNPEAARLAGISVPAVKLATFALTGVLVGLATVVSVPRLSVVDTNVGVGFELLAVTCVVVGGTSIKGGTGTLLGTVLGVLLLGSVRTVLIFMNLGEGALYWERAIQGALILLAVLSDHLARRREVSE